MIERMGKVTCTLAELNLKEYRHSPTEDISQHG